MKNKQTKNSPKTQPIKFASKSQFCCIPNALEQPQQQQILSFYQAVIWSQSA